MTKSLNIMPKDWFKAGKISFKDIPVCQYKKTLAEEKKIFTKEDFLNIYHDMQVCHHFETIINEIKLQGKYEGIEYKHPGPAHLSLGQECTAVGAAYLAGLAAGVWSTPDEIAKNRRLEQVFAPKMPADQAQAYLHQWHRAVSRSLKWEE